jgi:dihydroorotate dehydrogenase
LFTLKFMYGLLRPFLFMLDSEKAHSVAISLASWANTPIGGSLFKLMYDFEDPCLETTVAGLTFRSPVGIAAGFDKEARAISFADLVGASHLEVGTVTLNPQRGNEGPRMFRYPQAEAIINRLGFPSSGVSAVLPRLSAWRNQKGRLHVGVNIGKNKDVAIEHAADHYQQLIRQVKDVASYVTLNVSSPNTPELRKLQEPERLRALIQSCRDGCKIPLFVKLSPDIEARDLLDILKVLVEEQVDAIISSNTTVSRDGFSAGIDVQGGLSGRPLFDRSLAMVRTLYKDLRGMIPIVGVGGIDSGERAVLMIRNGASLVQLYTAMVFKGPSVISGINRHIVATLKREGITHISHLCGIDVR